MKINIVSKDNRFIKVNELLLQKGHNSFICSLETYTECDCLVLSVGNEFSDDELKRLLFKVGENTLVITGNKQRVKRYFNGTVFDYTENDMFVEDNAALTAEATVSYLHNLTKSSLRGKKIFVSGYGRISKCLCRLLKAMGSCVFVYARRKEIMEQIAKDGYVPSYLTVCTSCDIVINTVPFNIFSKEIISCISRDAFIVDLASSPYGFEEMDRVNLASGLPGKALPLSAANAVFNVIESMLSSNGKDNI